MSNLYAYKTIFTIDSNFALDDFWSFIIFRLNLEQSHYTYDRFARLYNLLSEHKDQLSEHSVVYIILEESNEKFFLSIDTTLNEFLEQMTSRLDALNFSYLYESNLLSYSINKKQVHMNESISLKKNNYTFMDLQDLETMHNILEKMQSKKYNQESSTFTLKELNDYKNTFSRYSGFLRYYPQLSSVNNVVAELSVILSLYADECLRVGVDFKEILHIFLSNLIQWQDKLFVKGSDKLDFMDKSFKDELLQIKIVLKLYDDFSTQNKKLYEDDVFDF